MTGGMWFSRFEKREQVFVEELIFQIVIVGNILVG